MVDGDVEEGDECASKNDIHLRSDDVPLSPPSGLAAQ